MLAAMNSGSGKTVVTCALLAALPLLRAVLALLLELMQ